MPEVECPIPGCDYKTPDQEASIIAVLIDAHCRNHEKSQNTATSPPMVPARVDDRNIQANSRENTLQLTREYQSRRAQIISMILCTVALILDLTLSFSIQYWFKRTDNFSSPNFMKNLTTLVTAGLWRGCVVYHGEMEGEKCFDYDYENFNLTFLGAAQVSQCLGVIFLVFSILTILLKLCRIVENEVPSYIAGINAIWAALCFVVSVGVVRPGLKRVNRLFKNYLNAWGVTTTYDEDLSRNIHLSFYFALVSALIALFGGIYILTEEFERYIKNRRERAYTRIRNDDDRLI